MMKELINKLEVKSQKSFKAYDALRRQQPGNLSAITSEKATYHTLDECIEITKEEYAYMKNKLIEEISLLKSQSKSPEYHLALEHVLTHIKIFF